MPNAHYWKLKCIYDFLYITTTKNQTFFKNQYVLTSFKVLKRHFFLISLFSCLSPQVPPRFGPRADICVGIMPDTPKEQVPQKVIEQIIKEVKITEKASWSSSLTLGIVLTLLFTALITAAITAAFFYFFCMNRSGSDVGAEEPGS